MFLILFYFKNVNILILFISSTNQYKLYIWKQYGRQIS